MRVKLIDVFCAVLGADPDYRNEEAIQFVDELIANGVTVQKWIPVTERLPKAFRAVLAYCPSGGNIYEVYLNTRSEWHFFDETVAGAVLQDAVTHWMPLPEAPKGE